LPLSPQTRLGPYEILSPLGAGGMGEVYKAKDTRLDRTVAIKVLPEHVAANPEARQRFEREARAVSSLNHPNICVLHDIGQQDGVDFLVMEYLEGETLAARLAKGPLPVAQALEYAIQIADALAQAHRRGFCHRDLKPGNIMLTRSGAKLLDFGLAKRAPTALANEATVSVDLTGKGTILGTLPYMAPEQVEGREADARTDLFAFGAVLYEMVTGRKAFPGQTAANLMVAILERDPPPLPGSCPPALDRLVRRCLAKDPDQRWQNAQDLKVALQWIVEGTPVQPAPVTRRLLPWAAAALATVAALVLAALYFRPTPSSERTVRLLVSPPEKETFWSYDLPAVSPDGERLAFTAIDPDGKTRIWVRSLDSLTISPLAGADGGIRPFWSPDSRSLAFFADGKLKKADLRGGPPQTLCDASNWNPFGAWGRDGVILFGNGDSGGRTLSRVAATGGEVRLATTLDVSRQEAGHDYPQFLPDGRHFIYLVQSARPENSGIYAGSLDSKETKRLVSTQTNAAYAGSPSGSGYLLFTRDDALMAQAFDAARLELTGAPLPVTQPVSISSTIVTARLLALFAVSENGVLAYRTGGSTGAIELVWFDRQGKRLGTVGEPADYSNPALSPDEKKLVVCRVNPQARTRDLWLFDLARGTSSRFTFDPADKTNPVWSPDGSRIAFSSRRRGALDVYVKAATGSGADDVLLESREDKVVLDWTPDGRFILFSQGDDYWTVPLEGDRKPKGSLELGDSPRVSPNGGWVAYGSNESSRGDVYVQSFPPGGGKWQVSTAGGTEPQWRRDGKELFYRAADKLMAVDVKTDAPVFEAGIPKPLFAVRVEKVGRRSHFVVAASGQRFLVAVEAAPSPLTLVTNWTAGLKR
jgi:serine/threonine protein kinase/WD40 repeat protein